MWRKMIAVAAAFFISAKAIPPPSLLSSPPPPPRMPSVSPSAPPSSTAIPPPPVSPPPAGGGDGEKVRNLNDFRCSVWASHVWKQRFCVDGIFCINRPNRDSWVHIEEMDMVPGWRLGWNDPDSILTNHRITESIKGFLDISSDPATFIQGAIPEILENTPSDFFDKVVSMLRESAEICYKLVQEIPCITCPTKPQGCMFLMMKLNLWMLEGIEDDLDFCCKLAKEESVILLPGIRLGLKNWVRVTFAVEPSYIFNAFRRLRAFYQRYAKKQLTNALVYN